MEHLVLNLRTEFWTNSNLRTLVGHIRRCTKLPCIAHSEGPRNLMKCDTYTKNECCTILNLFTAPLGYIVRIGNLI